MGSRVASTIELPSIGCDPVAPGKVCDVNSDVDSILVEVEILVTNWLNLSEAAEAENTGRLIRGLSRNKPPLSRAFRSLLPLER